MAFPPDSEVHWVDRVEEWPGKWLKDTHGRLGDLILMPTRAQHMMSKSTRAVEFARVRSGFEAQVSDGEVGAAQRLFAFHEYTAEHSGDWVMAQPWMEDGELCTGLFSTSAPQRISTNDACASASAGVGFLWVCYTPSYAAAAARHRRYAADR